ncbi:MAG: GxxExxY protein [Planctomycetes bacterium]|nr:GxxExxY protein [Planctomycetota bacterium]
MGTEEQDPQTGAIIGAAMEVHRELGHGFKEVVYHEALAKELQARGIAFEHEPVISVHYKGEKLQSTLRPDFICFGEVVVELKAVSALTDADRSQVLYYLKATGLKRGLVINFGAPSLQVKRARWDF